MAFFLRLKCSRPSFMANGYVCTCFHRNRGVYVCAMRKQCVKFTCKHFAVRFFFHDFHIHCELIRTSHIFTLFHMLPFAPSTIHHEFLN